VAEAAPTQQKTQQRTRQKLLDAAMRLFAEKGIANVSLAEVVRAAGQRNASAVHYHLGNRNQLTVALLEPHVQAIRTRRLELLAKARAQPPDDVRSAIEAMVRPLTELAGRGWRQRAYLKVGQELMWQRDQCSPEIRALMDATAGYDVAALIRERCPPVPDEIWQLRIDICVQFVGSAAAERARLMDRRGRGRVEPVSDEVFVDNLIDMFHGALTATANYPPATAR
jgi:AcrR family transcriptional regulator